MQRIEIKIQITGRACYREPNDTHDIIGLVAWEGGANLPQEEPEVYIEAVGKGDLAKYEVLDIPRSALIEFCTEVLKQVQPPQGGK